MRIVQLQTKRQRHNNNTRKKTESSTILVQSMSVIVCDFMQMRNFWTDNDCDNEIIGK